MYNYYFTAPAATASRMADGRSYVYGNAYMRKLPDGRRGACLNVKTMLRMVDFVENDVAFASIGKAGDAIACIENLPVNVAVRHSADFDAANDI